MEKRILLGVTLLASASAYFDYKTDCRLECQVQKLPCIISELSHRHFPCDCISTNAACVHRASSNVVCLRPDAEPTGGSDIWVDYWNYTHPNPPVPPPSPRPNQKISFLQIYAAIVTTILVIQGGSSLIRCVAQTWRRRQYRHLGSMPTPPGGEHHNREPVYQPTVQEI